MLFVELGLIRWLGENVIYLSYFTNFVLLSSFLGIGLGFLAVNRRGSMKWFPLTLFLIVAVVGLFPVEIERSGSEVIFFGRPDVAGLPIWVMLPAVFAGVVSCLFLIGQAVAREFIKFAPLTAYRLDIAGSIAGVAAFALLSWLSAPPVVWSLGVLFVVVAVCREAVTRMGVALLVGVVVMLSGQSLAPDLSWSPYYKIGLRYFDHAVQVDVNGIPHQEITTVEFRRAHAPILFLPYEFVGSAPDRVLIIGAGAGNDVAIALSMGAHHVDAVEIDPKLFQLGVDLHPDDPYADPRVAGIIDDGRAWMERSPGQYDVILFALPDSLTLVPGASSLRLESFLFTQEALDKAHELLAPGGVFAMYNFYREDWLIGRLTRTMTNAFGGEVCVVAPDGSQGLALLATGGSSSILCPSSSAGFLVEAPPPVTDDYPFLYVREPGVPRLYLVALASLLVISVASIRATGTSLSAVRINADLFLMGIAFLLLETKSVVQFSLWFGTTWSVNALVFLGVLISVLAAIEVVKLGWVPRPTVMYGLLLIAVAASWAMPASVLLALPTLPRFVLAVLITFTPIFVANVVFAQRFATTENSALAFGANLLGAMVGGIFEYASLIVGYRALAIVVAVVYLSAYFAWRRIGSPVVETRLSQAMTS